VLAYSFEGSIRGRALATDLVLSPDGRRAALHAGIGRVAVVDVQTLAPVSQLDFTSPVSLVSFATDGNHLVVLDGDQTVYTINLGGR
jgi:hypothetical protein